jgi:hypothetical protein
MIHGSQQQHSVKIMDKSKRAYDCSIESTRALELAISKDERSCSTCPTRFKSVIYSLWIMFFKTHGPPPRTDLNGWFMLFSFALSLEFLLTVVFILHICNPLTNALHFGLPFLFIMPGLPVIAPLWGLLAVLAGSAQMLTTYSNMNAVLVLVNYPLTIAFLIFEQEPATYLAIVCLLLLNKVGLSFFGSKVRQHYVNPTFAKN